MPIARSALRYSFVTAAEAPPPPPTPGDLSTTFTLNSTSTGTKEFTIGHCFVQGDISSLQGVLVTGAEAQVIPKNYWPDGSLKFAVISGTWVQSVANTPVTVSLSPGTYSSGTALTTNALKTAMIGQTCSIGCGVFGTVSWSGTDWDNPFQTWISGHRMSSWVFRKAVGSDSHLVGWLEVRYYSTGAIEILPWIENGYLNVSGPTSKSATYTFTLGSTTRFSQAIDLPHHCRTALVSGSLLSHWLGTDPATSPLHNAAYMMASELVPTYAGSVAANASIVTALPSTYTPLQAGSISYSADDMTSTGYQAPIGLLPEHDVLYLTAAESARPSVYASVIRNGYSAGRYAFHARDETTNRPPAFSTYPTLVWGSGGIRDAGASTTNSYTPSSTGTAPPLWDTAHAPSVGFMAYLLTGRFYFMEEVQLCATTIHFSVTDWVRGGGVTGGAPAPGYTGASGIVSGYVQLRAGAWWMRTLSQALCVTPTSDFLFTEFKASVQNTVNFHHAKYVAQSNNPFGFVQPDVDYGTTGIYRSSPWMQDFYTAAFGYAKAMGLPLDTTPTTNLTEFFAWTAQSVVGRLGTSSSPDWWYINAAPYTIAVAPTDTPNWTNGTGPWYASWREMYDATAATEPNRGSTEGVLTGNTEAFPETTSPAQWHNLQPALAYAVRHNVSGASEAYTRMINAANWNLMATVWASKPVWSVKPTRPAWLAELGVNQATSLAGTTIRYGQGPGTRLAYCGLANRDTLLVLAATGGHGDSSDNGVDSLDLAADVPAWTNRIAPYGSPVLSVNYYRTTPTVEPSSRHTYNRTIWNAQRQRMLLHGTSSPWGSGGGLPINASNGLNLETWAWDPAGTIGDSGGVIVQDSGGRGYAIRNYFGVDEYDPITNTVTQLPGFANEVTRTIAYDSTRDVFFQCTWGDGQGGGSGRRLYRYTSRFATQTAITFNASAAATALSADTTSDCTMFYAAAMDAYYYWTGTVLYKITPNTGTTWDVSVITITGEALPSSSHAHTRACYVPSLKCMAYLPSDSGLLYVVRLA